jgi:hypothetical protein
LVGPAFSTEGTEEHRGKKAQRERVGDSSLCSDAKAKTLTTKGTKELKAFVWSPCFYHRGHRGNTEGKRPERRLE